ncbi:MAG TPA: hypothetical protein VHS56_06535, partial [Candidatus Cybelea sp.]|nr:hypothetical protein [Candidatus Cybelea sp.]
MLEILLESVQQQRPLVTSGLVGDLLEEPVQGIAHAAVAAEARRDVAATSQGGDDVISANGKIG